jgi:exonuclease 3'-5' domain-containing protein 1
MSVYHKYCTTLDDISLTHHLNEIITSSTNKTPYILLDCEGRGLGSCGGKLGVIQIGIAGTPYLVDVIVFPDAVAILRKYFVSLRPLKYVWDGRSDFSELRHGHGITLRNLTDLRLADMYASMGSPHTVKAIRLSNIIVAAQNRTAMRSSEIPQICSGIYLPNVTS